LAAIVPPLNENDVAFGTATTVPPQVVVGEAGAAMNIPAGKLSVNATPVKTALLGLERVRVRVEAEPPKTVFGEKLLLTLILREATVKEADAEVGLEIFVDVPWIVPVRSPAAIVFDQLPVVTPTTSSTTVQIPGTPPTCAGIVALLKEIFRVPAVATRTASEPQLVYALAGLAIITPL